MTERRPPIAERPRRVRWRTIVLTTAILAVVFLFASGPRAPARTNPVAGTAGNRTIRGAFHIHTTRSDGALEKREVAAAAARAGLQFAIFTDHGDGTRSPDAPEYVDGVLCLDGAEISTNDGHYIGVGMTASPYPLGGDGEAVAEDVARLGGFGVAAHPGSPRPELAWSDWNVPFEAIEWLNADSEWRDETRMRLARSLLDYVWRPAGALAALLDRPVEVLRRWDEATVRRRVVALAGHDAHGGLGAETASTRGRRVHLPSYESSFRTFSVYATLSAPPTANAERDAALLLSALREGQVFTALDAIAAPTDFSFSAAVDGTSARMGSVLPAGPGPARFTVRAAVPSGATVALLRDGRAIAEEATGELSHDAATPGAYRVEIRVPQAPGIPPVPWLVSNPIYRFAAAAEPAVIPDAAAAVSLIAKPWRVESDDESAGTLTADDKSVALQYRLRGGAKANQFVALVTDLAAVPAEVNTLVLRARASRPMRASAQLRFANDGHARWRKSIYLDDAVEREVRIPFDRLRRADPEARSGNSRADRGAARPDVTRATSLLLVVDLTNAVPGAQGSLTLTEAALVRDERGEIRSSR